MAKATGIHWFTPTCMLGYLIAGALFATGHHLFYLRLNGTEVSTTPYLGLPVSHQEVSIAIGTAFAFLAKAALVLAMSLAYVQLFWHEAKPPRSRKAPTLGALDWTYSALDNLLVFFNLPLWWRVPSLQLLAAAVWLVPIASIITPATLTVRTAAVSPAPTSSQRVPNLDFRSTNFLAEMPPNATAQIFDFSSFYPYNGPSLSVATITSTVMAQGAILPITAPTVNASWDLEFFGPSLQCSNISGGLRDVLRYSVNSHMPMYPGYFVWFPGSSGWWNGTFSTGLPFYGPNQGYSEIYGPEPQNAMFYQFSPGTLISKTGVNLTMYLLLVPPGSSSLSQNAFPSATALQCQLVNSTYYVSFRYGEGFQDITYGVDRVDFDSTVTAVKSVFVNSQSLDDPGKSLGSCLESDIDCYRNPKLLQTLSYQAVMDAFTQRLEGRISWDSMNVSSTVLETTIGETDELIPLKTAVQMNQTGTFESFVSQLNGTEYQGLTTHNKGHSQLPLTDAIEQLFLNVTISLMSYQALQPNYSSISAPPPVNVTLHRYHNVYIYHAWKLWLPYGIAIVLCCNAVVVGFFTMFVNGSSYSDDFSTIFRAARGAKLHVNLKEEDLDGKDPLPQDLEEASVRLRKARKHEGSKGRYMRTFFPLNAPLDLHLGTRTPSTRRSSLGSQKKCESRQSRSGDSVTPEQ